MANTKSIHSTAPIPLAERRGPLTMGLLWITMVTGFPSLLVGFEWYKNGFTFSQTLLCTILSCLMLLIYSVPAAQLGAQTGLGYTTLTLGVFGRLGSWLVTFNLIWMFTLFYGVTAVFLADSVNGLLHINWSLAWFAAGLALIMSANNFFGFKGVANFARYFAAPMLLVWVGYVFYKAVSVSTPSILVEKPHQSFSLALTTISTFIIGFAVWGNEKDYWRFSIPKPIYCVIPLTVALAIGQIIFPITGWLVARMTGITEYAAATAFMNNYAFGGIGLIGVLVLGASYFAANDSNMFASVQACETVKDMPHKNWVLIVAIVSAITAFLLSISGTAKSLEIITALNCVINPTPTVIMLAEWFLLAAVFKTVSISNASPGAFKTQIPFLRWPAIIALLAGIGVGLLTAGVIPGLDRLHVGICSLQAWLTALVVYIPLRLIEHKQTMLEHHETLEKVLAKRFEEAAARLPITEV